MLPIAPLLEDGMLIFMSLVMPGIDAIPFIPDIPLMPDMWVRVGRAAAGAMPVMSFMSFMPAMPFALDALPLTCGMPGMDPIPGISAIPRRPDAAVATVPPLVLVSRLRCGERGASIPAIPGMLVVAVVLSTARP
jgi:hypothetical protein